MKVINLEEAKLEACVRAARRQTVVFTRRGKPVAVLVGIKGMDLEQVKLSLDPEFWAMIEERRKQPTITHAELLKELEEEDRSPNGKPPRKKVKTSS
jgi:antitoxin (DNA-binding transcriptional repressor) of toxin-antitoxin stability system